MNVIPVARAPAIFSSPLWCRASKCLCGYLLVNKLRRTAFFSFVEDTWRSKGNQKKEGCYCTHPRIQSTVEKTSRNIELSAIYVETKQENYVFSKELYALLTEYSEYVNVEITKLAALNRDRSDVFDFFSEPFTVQKGIYSQWNAMEINSGFSSTLG